jgi:hypothetical protein
MPTIAYLRLHYLGLSTRTFEICSNYELFGHSFVSGGALSSQITYALSI